MTTQAPHFDLSIATPASWLTIDPADLEEGGALANLAAERLDDVPQLAPYKEQLLGTMGRTLESAKEGGVVHTAILADITETEKPLLATMTVAFTTAPPPPVGDEEDARLADVEQAFDEAEPDVEQHVVSSMILAGGPAVRIARIMNLPIVGEGDQAVALAILSVEYFFAVPNESAFVVMAFTTPTLEQHLDLQAEFHEIAAQLRFVTTDDAAPSGNGASPDA